MNAHVINNKAALWDGPLPSSFDGHFVPVMDDPQPELSGEQVIEPGELAIDYADGVPAQVRRTWTVRQKTDAEAQKISTQLILWKQLSAAERRELWNLANVDDTALLVLGAMWSAVETESRNPETKQLIGAAMQLGIVADVERARVILDDPGFSLE